MTSARFSTQNTSEAGSLSSSEPVFLVVGKLRRSHGLRGEIIMEVLTDFPERLKIGVELYIGENRRSLKLRTCRWHKDALIVSFEGFTTIEQANELRNQLAYVLTAECPPLPEGEYYHHQILGLHAVTTEGLALGTVCEILETGANDVYVIHPESGPDILVPYTAEVVIEIDLEKKQMTVAPLPGLLPQDLE